MAESLYNLDRQLQRALDRVRETPTLSAVKKQRILDFAEEMLLLGLSKGRVTRLTYYLRRLGEWLPGDFEAADLAAIRKLVARIDASPCVPFSRMEYKLVLRKFYRWLRQTESYPPEVSWIPIHVKPSERIKLPEQLLSEREVRALMEAARTPRDRAFVAMLYESGARIGELALLRIKQLQIDEFGARLAVRGKTGARSVRIVSSVPFLTAWPNAHPRTGDPEAYLWLSDPTRHPRHSTVSALLTRLAVRAGITKPVHPHLFRHSRATHLASHLTESQLKAHLGWVQASRMAAVYVHLSGRDVDRALLKLHGVERGHLNKQRSEFLKPQRCPRCGATNACTDRFCRACSRPLPATV